MRIGLTCTAVEASLTQGKIDGIGVYAKTLLDEYHALGLDVTPISFPPLKQLGSTSSLPRGKMLPLPYTAATLVSLLKPLAHSLHQPLSRQLDILHVTDHMVPRMNSIPVIATIHDALMFKHPEWYRSKLRKLKNSLRKQTMTWADHFITISNAMVPELVEYLGIPEEKISVVYNGISPWWQEDVSSETRENILAKLGIPGRFILFTGTLQPKKNIPTLIEAYLMLPEDLRKTYPLVIAGKAGWDTEESLNAIQKLTASQNGYWLNYVSDDEIRVLYHAASLYVFPSLHEGFGRTLLESFAGKTPVIASNIPALSEIAGDAAYLIDPMSRADLKQAMQTLLTSDSLPHSLIEKGLERLKAFTLQRCAEETLRVYHIV